jgi:hypothetical protein
MNSSDRRIKIALAEYKEAAAQFRLLTNIRFKLLAYLPLGTIATVFLTKEGGHLASEPAIAAFAFVATVCLATYDKRNDQHYDELVSRAAELEKKYLGLRHGTFTDRPGSWLLIFGLKVEHRWPIGLLYAATAAFWAYLLARSLAGAASLSSPVPDMMGLTAAVVVIGAWQLVGAIEQDHRKALRRFVEDLRKQLVRQSPPEDGVLKGVTTTLKEKCEQFGLKPEVVAGRAEHHWTAYAERHDLAAASKFLAATIDLPARWIEDVWTRRR